MNHESVTILSRFCGPTTSGNGGYVCGLVARHLSGTVTVRLKAPPPLAVPLRHEWSADGARLLHGETVIAEAKTDELAVEAPACPPLALAEAASRGFPGFLDHPFPRCFVCGPQRAPGDGLRIFSGPLPGGRQHAAPWTPHASLADASGNVERTYLWAALDCPSGFAADPAREGSALVLGELCASFTGRLRPDAPAVVSAWPIASEGRRRVAGSAIHDADGALVAHARAVWIEVPRERWTSPG